MAMSNRFITLSHCTVSQMRRPGGDVEGVEGKEGGSEPRVRVKTKENTQRWYSITTACLSCTRIRKTRCFSLLRLNQKGTLLKRNPVWLSLSLLPSQLISFSSSKWKLLPHLATHLPHIPFSDLMNVRGSGSHLRSLLHFKSADSFLFLFGSCFTPVCPRFPRFLYRLPIYIGDRKWPVQIERLLSCWGWWGR